MEADEFEKNKQAVIAKLLEKHKNLSEETSRYLAYISNGSYTFKKPYEMTDYIKLSITKEVILAFFDAKLAKGGCERRKLTVEVYGKSCSFPVEGKDDDQVGDNTVVIPDKATFRRGAKLWPCVTTPDFSQYQ